MEVIFKDPKSKGCFHSKRYIKWKEEYEQNEIQKILFVFNKEGKFIYINDIKIMDFYNEHNIIVNNWNDELKLYIGILKILLKKKVVIMI